MSWKITFPPACYSWKVRLIAVKICESEKWAQERGGTFREIAISSVKYMACSVLSKFAETIRCNEFVLSISCVTMNAILFILANCPILSLPLTSPQPIHHTSSFAISSHLIPSSHLRQAHGESEGGAPLRFFAHAGWRVHTGCCLQDLYLQRTVCEHVWESERYAPLLFSFVVFVCISLSFFCFISLRHFLLPSLLHFLFHFPHLHHHYFPSHLFSLPSFAFHSFLPRYRGCHCNWWWRKRRQSRNYPRKRQSASFSFLHCPLNDLMSCPV